MSNWLVVAFWIFVATPIYAQPATSQPARARVNIPVPRHSVHEKPRSEILVFSKRIDQMVRKFEGQQKLKPNPPANDDIFVRRLYLSIIGRIPTYREISVYRKRHDVKRRMELVDQLLDSDGYISHWYNYFADMLRIQSQRQQAQGKPYITWMKQSLRQNKPYDQFVYQMLTAEGYIWNNGAVGYYQRDMGMPLDNMSNTTRTFLGTRIGCAQCHDHPFDVWTQREYYEMAAYTYGLHTTANNTRHANMKKLYKMIRSEGDRSKRIFLQRAAREVLGPLSYDLYDKPGHRLKLPHDYKYSDAKPKSLVTPATMFGELAPVEKPQSSRKTFSKWLTSPQNPRFTKVIVNRLWKQVFGVGLIEPVDNIKDHTKATHPLLLDELVRQMQVLEYDVKQFLRVLYNTRLFGRSVARRQWDPTQKQVFTGPILLRMTANQWWDSMLTLSVVDLDERPGNVAGWRRYDYDKLEALRKADGETLYKIVADAAVKMKVQSEYQGDLKEVQAKLNAANKSGDKEEAQKLLAARRELWKKIQAQRNQVKKEVKPNETEIIDPRWHKVPKNLVRASELRQPAPPGHFLRQFGQSDRELIDHSYDDASVPQILTLINGPLFNQLMRKNSLLVQEVDAASSAPDKFRIIWLSMLGRLPTSSEMALALKEYKLSRTRGIADVVWALLNTREFSFVQ